MPLGHGPASKIMATYTYNVEQLFNDQDPSLVRSYIAPLLTWQDKKQRTTTCPVTYGIEEHCAGSISSHKLTIAWDVDVLRTYHHHLDDELTWLRRGGGPD